MKKKKYKIHLSFSQIRARLYSGISFKRDETFIPNIVLCIGVVFVRRGLRNLMDIYFFPENELLSNILAIVIGIFFIYLPDHSFSPLGGLKSKESLEKSIAKEVSDLLKR